MVAVGLFLNPQLDMDKPGDPSKHNLYSLCCVEITKRFDAFYKKLCHHHETRRLSSPLVNTALTAIFIAMPYAASPHL